MSSKFFLRGKSRPNVGLEDADASPRGQLDVKRKGVKRLLTNTYSSSTKALHKAKTSDKSKVLQGNGHDEEIPSDVEGEVDSDIEKKAEALSDEEETIQEKRLRLAKHYLKEIENQERSADQLEDVDKNAIAHRLQEDILEKAGRLQRCVADTCKDEAMKNIRSLSGHKLSPTCLVLSSDDKIIFSASKDGTLIKWCAMTGQRLKIMRLKLPKDSKSSLVAHTKPIASLAISTDNKYLASGGQDKLIHIWNPETMEFVHTFKGHRNTVSGLAFRKGTLDLYSASQDCSVKVWNLTEMVYVETLFGHHGAISAIDALARERAITAGGSDSTVRIWKIQEESQLVFTGHKGSIDCVRLINEEHFVSCGDDGSIALWGLLKKKPLVSIANAHGTGSNATPNWITSIAALPNTDLIASGSSDGSIHLWKCYNNFRGLTKLYSIQIDGFVNSLQFSSDGSFLVAAIGQEHRLGRWWKIKAKNSIAIVPLK